MITTCVFFVMLCVSFAIILYTEDMGEWLTILCSIGIAVSILGLIICVPTIISAHCNTEKKIYSNNLEYESLVKQCQIISSNYEDISKATVIQKVYEWNAEIYDEKYWANNPWTNWFWNQKVVNSLEYIDLKDYGL